MGLGKYMKGESIFCLLIHYFVYARSYSNCQLGEATFTDYNNSLFSLGSTPTELSTMAPIPDLANHAKWIVNNGALAISHSFVYPKKFQIRGYSMFVEFSIAL